MKSSKKLMIVLLALAIVTALSAGTLAIYTTSIDQAASTTVTAKTIYLTPGENFPYACSFALAPGQSDNSEVYKLFNTQGGKASEVAMSLHITPSFGNFFESYPYMTVQLLKGTPNGNDNQVVATWDLNNKTEAYNAEGLWAANEGVEHDYFLKVEWAGGSNDDALKNEMDNIALSQGGAQTISLDFSASQYIAPTNTSAQQ